MAIRPYQKQMSKGTSFMGNGLKPFPTGLLHNVIIIIL